MKALKLAAAAALLVAGAVMLGVIGTWLFVDDETLVSMLVKGVESLTDTRIGYQDGAGISRTWAPELRIDKLVIDDTQGRYRVETSSLRLQIGLADLLRGQLDIPHLLIGDASVNLLKSSAPNEPPAPATKQRPLDLSVLRLSPVLHELRIAPVSILVEGDRFELPATRIRELSLRLKPGTTGAELSAQLEVKGEKLAVAAILPDLDRAVRRNQIPFEISVTGAIADASVRGQVDLSRPAAAVSAELRAHFPDLNTISGAGTDIHIPGDLAMTANLDGPLNQLALEDLSANWTGTGQSSLKLQGRIANVVNLEGIELSLTGQLADAAWLAPLLPATLGELESAQLAARIVGDRSILEFHDLSVKARTVDELNLTMAGRLGLTQLLRSAELENLDLKVEFDAPTTFAARAMIFDEVPELGAIVARGDMRSISGDLVLENMTIKTKDAQGVEVALRGGIARIPLDPDKPNRGYDLQITMKAAKASLVAKRVGVDLPLSGPLNLACRIQGETQALQLNQVKVSAGDKRKTLIDAEGRLQFGNWSQADPLQAIDIVLRVRGRDTDLISAWTNQPFPAVAYHAQARLHTVSGRHRIDDYELATEKGEPLEFSETGSAEEIRFLPEFGIQGIRLDTRARTADVASLTELFKLDQRIPAIGPADLRVRISGTDKKLLMENLRFAAGQEDVLLLEAKGRMGYLSAAKNWRLTDTNIDLRARSTSSQALAKKFGYWIPQLGPVSARADINDKNKTMGIEAIWLVVGNADRPALKVTGSIGDVDKVRKVRLEAKLNLTGEDFARFAVDDRKMPKLGPLTGALLISDGDGSLGMDTLQMESIKHDILRLNLDGRFDDFAKPETFRLDFHLKAKDGNVLTALIGWDWPESKPVEIKAQIKKTAKGSLLEASSASGKEKMDMMLQANFQTNPPQIKGTITAHNFFLPDLAEKQSEKLAQASTEKTKSNKKQPVFSRKPLDLGWMKKADVDLLVDIQSFDRAYTEAVSAHLPILLESGLLSVKSASIAYPKGRADLTFLLDGRSHPSFDFTFSGDKLDLWRGLNIGQSESKAGFDAKNAELNLHVSLKSSGKSPHKMASNAQGALHMTMKHGKMRQSELQLLFVDIVGWVSNKAKQRYEHVNCAIANYSVQQGLVTTDAFFIDMDTITIAGEGTIDLGKERVDYTFLPKKKSRLIASADPVTIKGPLNDPSVSAIPYKSAALTFGQLVFAPYIFVGRMAAEGAYRELDEGNEDSSVCANYVKDLEKAREKQTGKKPTEKRTRNKPAKKKDPGSIKQRSLFFYDD